MNIPKWLLVCSLISTCCVTAQGSTQRVLTSAEDVVTAINSATEEILIVTDVLRAETVADALREALSVRGVPVYVAMSPVSVQENASYAASLALAGASVRLSETNGSFLVVDRQLVLAGPLIGSLNETDGAPSAYIDDPSYAAQFVEGFVQSFEAASVYTPEVE